MRRRRGCSIGSKKGRGPSGYVAVVQDVSALAAGASSHPRVARGHCISGIVPVSGRNAIPPAAREQDGLSPAAGSFETDDPPGTHVAGFNVNSIASLVRSADSSNSFDAMFWAKEGMRADAQSGVFSVFSRAVSAPARPAVRDCSMCRGAVSSGCFKGCDVGSKRGRGASGYAAVMHDDSELATGGYAHPWHNL